MTLWGAAISDFSWLTTYGQLVVTIAPQYGLDPALVTAIIEQESGGDPNAESPAGAVGLMQVVPLPGRPSAQQLLDPSTNINAGCTYLQECFSSFGGNETCAIAAYNAGIGAVEASNCDLSQLPSETQRYVPDVLNLYPVAVQALAQYVGGSTPPPTGQCPSGYVPDGSGGCIYQAPIIETTQGQTLVIIGGLAILGGGAYYALRHALK